MRIWVFSDIRVDASCSIIDNLHCGDCGREELRGVGVVVEKVREDLRE